MANNKKESTRSPGVRALAIFLTVLMVSGVVTGIVTILVNIFS